MPELALLAEFLTYVVVFSVMYRVVEIRSNEFWQPLRWNWPGRSWSGFLLAGAVLDFVLVGIGQSLPIPKLLPIHSFFVHVLAATLPSSFFLLLVTIVVELTYPAFH